MKRKLLILNIALAAALVYAGIRVRAGYRAARARETATMSRQVKAAPAPQFSPLPPPAPVLSSSYLDVAQKMLFDKSRDSTVIVETPPPPAPKPMPPLPRYHGQMSLPGETPLVVLSADEKAPHQAVHVGGEIGPFKLVEITARELAFEWDGQVVRKSVDELLDRTATVASAPGVDSGGFVMRPTPPPAPPAPQSRLGPGKDTGRGERYCQPNDSYGNGDVVDGYRKVVSSTPFGASCFWQPVRQ